MSLTRVGSDEEEFTVREHREEYNKLRLHFKTGRMFEE